MAEYIKREELINQIRLMANRSSVGETSLNDISAKTICSLILEAPTADVVSIEVFEQVKWERDTALKTLEEHGIGLGQKADVVEVVRCKNCKHWHEDTGWCYHHSHFMGDKGEFCHPWESANWKMFDGDDYCSDGEKKEGAEE
jgi:hypothetical protein